MKPPLIWCTITQLSSVDHCWAFVGRSSGQCIGIFCDESADSWGCGYSQKHNCCVVVLVPSVFGGLQLCCGQLSHHVVLGWTIQSDAFFVIDWVILVYDWLCVQGRQEDIRKSDAVAARLRLQHVHGVVKVGDIVGCLQLCIPQAESFSTPACLMPLGEQIFILDEWALLCKKKKKSKLQHVKSWIAPPKVLIWHSIASHIPTDLWYMWREPPILCPRAFSFAAQLCYKLWVGTPLDGGVLPCIPYFVMFCPVFLSAIQLEKRDFKRHWTQWKVVSSKTHQSGRTNHNNT